MMNNVADGEMKQRSMMIRYDATDLAVCKED